MDAGKTPPPPVGAERDAPQGWGGERGARLLALILGSLERAQASDIVPISLEGKSSMADMMIVASGRSSRHLSAIFEALAADLKKAGRPPLGVEGVRQGDWILVDADDAIVHLFRPEVRSFYGLEKMWGPANPVF